MDEFNTQTQKFIDINRESRLNSMGKLQNGSHVSIIIEEICISRVTFADSRLFDKNLVKFRTRVAAETFIGRGIHDKRSAPPT